MKMVLVVICALLLFSSAEAQNTRKKTAVKKTTAAKKPTAKKANNTASYFSLPTSRRLTSISSHAALGRSSGFSNRLEISDPVIKALNAKANGGDLKPGTSGLPGVPKGTYGFAKGRILFYSTGATSQGTATGMGSVGTGTSPGIVGSFGPAMGVNGKSPYVGPNPHGPRLPLTLNQLVDTVKNKK